MSDLVLVLIVVPLCSGYLSAQGAILKRDEIWLNRHRALVSLFEHVFSEPLHTFPGHAPASRDGDLR